MLVKKRLIVLFAFILIVSVHGVALLQDSQNTQFSRDADTELQILTEINRWRVHRGFLPLMRNPDLDEIALEQADYISAKVPFEGEAGFHIDAYGDGVSKRALYYGWPAYDDDPNKELISEIAAYFPSVMGSIHFWQTSKPHHDAVETAGYREAGVAVLRKGDWLLSYVELAGRQDVLPVTYDAAHNTLYLSTDQSWYAEPFTPLYVRILDSKGNRLHSDDWLPWSERIRLPANPPNNLTVIVSDGIREITTNVDLSQSLIYPSDPPPPHVATTLSTFSPLTTNPSSTSTVSDETPAKTPTPIDGQFQVRMVYDNTSFSLINQSPAALDLSRLMISSHVINFSRDGQWLGHYSGVSVNRFPSTWCMQVWSFEVFTGPPAVPDGCTRMASGRSAVLAGERFWLANRFDVYYGGDLMTSCFRDTHECGFDVPASTDLTSN